MNRREAIAALVGLPATASLSVAQVKPDDVIVVHCTEHLTTHQQDHIRRTIEGVWPGRKAIIVDRGMTLSVARGQ